MAKTKANIRDRALQMLNLLAVGQTAESEIASDFEDAYDQVYAKLSRDGLVSWLSNSVPDEFVEEVATLVAARRLEDVPMETKQEILAKAREAKLSISASHQGKWVNPLRQENF
jgi:hypothetical protein